MQMRMGTGGGCGEVEMPLGVSGRVIEGQSLQVVGSRGLQSLPFPKNRILQAWG